MGTSETLVLVPCESTTNSSTVVDAWPLLLQAVDVG